MRVPRVVQFAQGSGDAQVIRVVQIVIACPILKQIAQNVQSLGFGRDVGNKAQEQGRAERMILAQVQVGDEEGM